jgi:hypothetical protein
MLKLKILDYLKNRGLLQRKTKKEDALIHNQEMQEKHAQLLKERGIEQKKKLKQIDSKDLLKIRKIISFWSKSKKNNKKEMIELLMSLDRGLNRKFQKTEDLEDGLIISPILAYGFGEMFSYYIKENLTKKGNKNKDIIESTILARKVFTDDIEINMFSSSFLRFPKSIRLEVYSNLEKVFLESILKPYHDYLRQHSNDINSIVVENSLKVHTNRLKLIKEFLLIEDNAPKW